MVLDRFGGQIRARIEIINSSFVIEFHWFCMVFDRFGGQIRARIEIRTFDLADLTFGPDVLI